MNGLLVEWMNQLRLDDGSFIMHIGGEVDIRGVYCALSVAMLTNTFSEELFHKTAQWVLKYAYVLRIRNFVIEGVACQPPA